MKICDFECCNEMADIWIEIEEWNEEDKRYYEFCKLHWGEVERFINKLRKRVKEKNNE